jgi:predicted Zn-dependent protease
LLGDTYLRSADTTLAIAVLEPAVRDRPQRKDLADRLAAAYRGAGREAEASAVDARFC